MLAGWLTGSGQKKLFYLLFTRNQPEEQKRRDAFTENNYYSFLVFRAVPGQFFQSFGRLFS
jgi:hypothetical protein